MLRVLGILLFVIFKVDGEPFSDEVNARMPRLFHLDDHDRCLLQKDGLYCLGVFELAPVEPSPVYEYIKEYSNAFTPPFNRSRLHRGYCVSARCPSKERNATLRFERCVDERARRHALSARIHRLHYCTTQEQHKARAEQPLDSSQRLFVRVVCAILVLNLIGTVYDVTTGDSGNKMGILMVWSVRASWRKLNATYDDGDPRLKNLAPIQGLRVVSTILIVLVHVSLLHSHFYVTNPNFLEKNTSVAAFMVSGSSLTHVFVMISSFLTAYNMLLYSQTHSLSFWYIPLLAIKRIIRIAPVHLLLVGFAATWWPQTRSGALSAIIAENSAICRRKFWTHVFFLNNIVDKHNMCLPPTWFLPVDMHLFIVACGFTILMSRRRKHAYRVYGTLLILSALLCGVVSYVTGWRSAIDCVAPEKLRELFVLNTEKSFGAFYTSTWGALPACFAGLLMAHLHYDLQERKYNRDENQWLRHLQYWSIPAVFAYVIATGMILPHYRHPLVWAVHTALDRPLFLFITSFAMFGAISVDSPIRSFFGWKGWRVTARLSLSVILCHWIIIVAISARPAAYHTSFFDMFVDYAATMFFTHLIAVPIALLVEIPVQRFISQFV